MTLNLMGREVLASNWLEQVEDHFKAALDAVPTSSEAFFYMGVAYKMAYRFQDAAVHFMRVIELDGEFVREASAEYDVIQKIEMSQPASRIKE